MTTEQLTKGQEVASIIHQRAHWRVRIIPPDATKRIDSQAQCLDFVRRAAVRLRGIDYPLVEFDSRFGGNYAVPGGWEGWDTFHDLGVWRFLQSGQFLHQFTLREEGEDGWGKSISVDRSVLSFENTIFQLTEVTEYLARLVTLIDYEPELELRIDLIGTQNRQLVSDPSRWLRPDRIAGAKEIPLERKLRPSWIPAHSRQLCSGLAVELLRYFGGLETTHEIVSSLQDKILPH